MYKSRKILIRHLLNYGMDTQPMLHILRYLEQIVRSYLDFRNGKLDEKSEEGIFLGYSTRSKSYKYLNNNTNKVVESANVKFDEYTEIDEDEQKKEPENYKTFMYYYEDIQWMMSCRQELSYSQELSCSQKMRYNLILK